MKKAWCENLVLLKRGQHWATEVAVRCWQQRLQLTLLAITTSEGHRATRYPPRREARPQLVNKGLSELVCASPPGKGREGQTHVVASLSRNGNDDTDSALAHKTERLHKLPVVYTDVL